MWPWLPEIPPWRVCPVGEPYSLPSRLLLKCRCPWEGDTEVTGPSRHQRLCRCFLPCWTEMMKPNRGRGGVWAWGAQAGCPNTPAFPESSVTPFLAHWAPCYSKRLANPALIKQAEDHSHHVSLWMRSLPTQLWACGGRESQRWGYKGWKIGSKKHVIVSVCGMSKSYKLPRILQ